MTTCRFRQKISLFSAARAPTLFTGLKPLEFPILDQALTLQLLTEELASIRFFFLGQCTLGTGQQMARKLTCTGQVVRLQLQTYLELSICIFRTMEAPHRRLCY